MLITVHPTLMTMCMTWGQHVLLMLYNVTSFQNLLLHSLKSHDQSCDYAINLWLMWQCDWSTLTQVVLKIEKEKEKERKIKLKEKRKLKMKSIVNNLDIKDLAYYLV